MGILSWFRRKNYEGTQQKISQMQIDINKFGTKSARDTAEREANVLKSLKNSVYKQDQNRINSLITLFNQLDSQQLEMSEKPAQVKRKIATIGIKKKDKKTVKGLVKDLEKLAKEFDNLVKKNRVDIEDIKASIKDNDFKFAEMLINKAIESQQDLKKKAMEIERLENQVNIRLVTPIRRVLNKIHV